MSIKAVISIWPYHGPSLKGWTVAIRDPVTDELWRRLFYCNADAKKLKEDLEGKSLEDILDIYGTNYFVRVL